jgi:hypothetical protein
MDVCRQSCKLIAAFLTETCRLVILLSAFRAMFHQDKSRLSIKEKQYSYTTNGGFLTARREIIGLTPAKTFEQLSVRSAIHNNHGSIQFFETIAIWASYKRLDASQADILP